MAVGICVVLAASFPSAARAETRIADLSGEWHGSGTDRNLPVESLQPTTCQTTIRADLKTMTSEMVCEGHSGVRKVILLKATLDGDRLTGTVRQTMTAPGNASPSEMNGTVTGHRTDDSASLVVKWSGWQPDATVTLKLNNPSSYSLHVSTLGATMSDVTFTRVGKR